MCSKIASIEPIQSANSGKKQIGDLVEKPNWTLCIQVPANMFHSLLYDSYNNFLCNGLFTLRVTVTEGSTGK